MILRHPGAIEGAGLVSVVLCCVCARVCYDGNSQAHHTYSGKFWRALNLAKWPLKLAIHTMRHMYKCINC